MRRIDIVRRAGKNLKKAKLRTALTSLAIAVGATTIALALAAGKGGQAYVDNISSKIGDQNAISVTRVFETKNSEFKPKKVDEKAEEKEELEANRHTLNQADADKISKIDGVRKVNLGVDVSAESVRISGGEKFQASVISKLDEQAIELSAGKLSENNQIPKNGVVAPKDYVKSLGAENPSDLIGKKVILGFRKMNGETFEREFEIVAVDNGKTDLAFGYNYDFVISNDDGLPISKEKYGEKLAFYYLSVNTDGSREIEAVKNDIMNLDSSRYDAKSFADHKQTVSQVVMIASLGLAGFGFLAVLASVFGVINTQYISVLERTSQIGLMKSLGAKKSDIAKIFRYEAAVIGFFGGAIGVAVAWIFTLAGNKILASMFKIDASKIGGELLQMDFPACGIMIISLMVVAVISGYLPARKAAKLNPIEALRTE